MPKTRFIPTKKVMMNTVQDGLVGGVGGGATVGIMRGILGLQLGSIVGGIIAGALLHGYNPSVARIVNINGVMDGVAAAFLSE